MRLAFVAISVWKFTWFRSSVSASWHVRRSPSTRRIGSRACTTVPSGTAASSPVNSTVASLASSSGEQIRARSR